MYLFNLFKMDSWTMVGFIGQFFFFASLVVQWYQSEMVKKSILTKEFWWLRLVGSLILIVYVLHRKDIVFLLATVMQICIYLRNLALIKSNE